MIIKEFEVRKERGKTGVGTGDRNKRYWMGFSNGSVQPVRPMGLWAKSGLLIGRKEERSENDWNCPW